VTAGAGVMVEARLSPLAYRLYRSHLATASRTAVHGQYDVRGMKRGNFTFSGLPTPPLRGRMSMA